MSSSVGQGLPRVDTVGVDTAGVVVEIQHLALHSPNHPPLIQDLTLYLPAHALIAVAPQSAVSVSALLAALAGIHPPDSGKILFDGTNLYEYRRALIPRIGFVPAQSTLSPGLKVAEALEMAASLRLPRSIDASMRSARVEALLDQSGLAAVKDQSIRGLTANQRYITQVAVESVAFPSLLLIDRPGEGLSSGMENELVGFLRELTHQGATVLFAAPSSRAMALADLLLILDPDGGPVWFGPPAEATPYFDGLRSKDPQIPPQPGIDDILAAISNSNGVSTADRVSWFQTSPVYAKYVETPRHTRNRDLMLEDRPLSRLRQKTTQGQPPVVIPRSTGVQQYFVFLTRNFKTLARDPFGLTLSFVAPVLFGIGLLLAASPGLYDPVRGDAAQIDLILGLLVFLTILISSVGRSQDVSRENLAFRRERQLTFGTLPYALAKLSLVVLIAIYQGLVVTGAYFAAIGFAGGLSALAGFWITLTLVAVIGGLVGLIASALTSSPQGGIALALLLVIPQFLFGSALIPASDLGAVGKGIAAVTPARYAFEALVTASGYGIDVAQDVCWALPAAQRQALSEDQKQNCTCMGNNIFSKCNFPGIRQAVTPLLDQPQPVEPTPDPAINQIPVQPVLRQGETLDQYSAEINRYTLQLERYQGVVSGYLAGMRQFLTDATNWEKQQNYAIGAAETRIADEINDYGSIYNEDVGALWLTLSGFSLLLAILYTGIQSRKGRG